MTKWQPARENQKLGRRSYEQITQDEFILPAVETADSMRKTALKHYYSAVGSSRPQWRVERNL